MATGSFLHVDYDSEVDYNHRDYREALTLQAGVESLLPRGRQALQALADGLTLVETAEVIGIGYGTMRGHITEARSRLCARTRPSAIFAALALGMLMVTYPDGERGLSTGTIEPNGVHDLVDKDIKIIYMLAQGMKSAEIQKVLGYKQRGSLSYRITGIKKRLGVNNRESIIRRAYEIGMIDPHNGGPPETPPYWQP